MNKHKSDNISHTRFICYLAPDSRHQALIEANATIGAVPAAHSKTRKKTALLLLAVAALLAGGAAAAHGQSALDGFDPNANGQIRVVVRQADGKILLGGDFTSLAPNGGPPVTRNNIARLNPNGSLDTAFDPNANGFPLAMAVQADGKILVGGVFTTIGGQPRNRIARLDATTGQADSFDPNPNTTSLVDCFALQPDGKIVVGGEFTSIGGQLRNRIARLDPVTGLADSFNPNANALVFTVSVQADGRILAGGNFTSIGGQMRNRMAGLDPSTGLADGFDPNANGIINSFAVQADGNIVVGGFFTTIGGQNRSNIARVNAVTGLADSFNPNANDQVLSMVVQADGKILVGGPFTNIGGQARNFIARLDPITGLADSFNPDANGFVNSSSIVVQPDGKILVGGGFGTIGGQTRNFIARLETDGRLDQTLDLSMIGGFVQATAVQADGKVLIGGFFSSVLGRLRNNIARLNTDGTVDDLFDPNADDSVRSIAVQADGKILVGGDFTIIGGQFQNHIARLDPSTGDADSFDPDANSIVFSIAVQPDGKILAGGFFTGIGGQTRNRIARLDPATGLADSFDPNASGAVFVVAVQADGKILAGGSFNGASSIGGQTRNRIARLDATSGLADSFDPDANNSVESIALQPDGKVVAGGDFTNIGGQTRNRIARLDPTSGLADSFNPNANNSVLSIALQADGKILAGGFFNGTNSIGGATRNRVARLDPTTGLADSFDPNADDFVLSIAVQADGKILAGGIFVNIGGQARLFFARLANDTIAGQNLVATSSSVTWTRSGSSPQFTRVTFESSTDNVSFTPLGEGAASGSNWTLTGLNLPTQQNIYLRARGYYSTGDFNGSESTVESVRNAFLVPTPPPVTKLGNISTRLQVETGDNVLIGGFIITGTEPKKVLVRAIGPSLPLTGSLVDPVLELRNEAGDLIASNDNWMDSANRQEIIDSTIPPTNNLESAIVATLDPGPYTAIMRGKNNTTGIGLVEAYDLDQTIDSLLANISTRGLVQTGDDVMIGGFILLGTDPQPVLLRAIGPSLPLTGKLADPVLELHDKDGTLIVINDDWKNAANQQEIIDTGIPPTNDAESAILSDLVPDAYTAIVRGKNNSTGIALVEVYRLEQ